MKSPAVFHHVTLTVTDLPRSIDWYERVLGMTKVADREGPTWKRALMRSEGGLVIGLTAHEGTGSDRFDERRVGLDHLSIACEDRDEVAGLGATSRSSSAWNMETSWTRATDMS